MGIHPCWCGTQGTHAWQTHKAGSGHTWPRSRIEQQNKGVDDEGLLRQIDEALRWTFDMHTAGCAST